MKSQKLFVIATIVCLLVGVSGAAMAVDCGPEGGSIVGGTYDEIVITDFVSCKVVGVYVTDRVLVNGADQFTMINSLVDGNVRVINTKTAVLVDNTVNGGRLVAKGNLTSTVLRNIVTGGTIVVSDDTCEQEQSVLVAQNLIFTGNLRINCNEKADVKDNKVTNGSITCRENDRLDSIGNVALDGTVNCRRNLDLFD